MTLILIGLWRVAQMIKAATIVQSVRALLKDNSEMIYSDYDIKMALNSAIRFISQSTFLKDTDFLETEKTYSLTTAEEAKRGVELPDDYQSVTGVTTDNFSLGTVPTTKKPNADEFKIMGTKIYCGNKDFTITYKKLVMPVSDIETDNVDMPMFCLNVIIEVTIAILKGEETAAILNRMNEVITSDIPVRKYNGKRSKE